MLAKKQTAETAGNDANSKTDQDACVERQGRKQYYVIRTA